jgi:hypothetical protein
MYMGKSGDRFARFSRAARKGNPVQPFHPSVCDAMPRHKQTSQSRLRDMEENAPMVPWQARHGLAKGVRYHLVDKATRFQGPFPSLAHGVDDDRSYLCDRPHGPGGPTFDALSPRPSSHLTGVLLSGPPVLACV